MESLLQNLEVKVAREESLTDPVSTAALSDGRIVVCELNNHRIQVFEHLKGFKAWIKGLFGAHE